MIVNCNNFENLNIIIPPLNREAIKEAIEEAYWRAIEEENKPKRLSVKELIEVFGREEIKELATEKLQELQTDFDGSNNEYKKLDFKMYDDNTKMFLEVWTENTIGKQLEEIIKQLKFFSSLFLKSQYKFGIVAVRPGGLTEEQIEEAREYPLSDLYEGQLRGNKRLSGLCPFHEEKTPSFVIYTDNNSFHCFGCQAHGQNAIDYLMKKDKLNFQEAVRQLI